MKTTMTAAIAAMALAGSAQAAPILIAKGVLGGTSDLSGLTSTLENGVRADSLGGLGSGLAYVGGNTFLALPDRGPNAVSYNAAVDNTTSYIDRFQTVTLALTPQSNGLPFALNPVLTATTLLYAPTTPGDTSTALIYGTGAGLGNRTDGTPIGSGVPANNTLLKNYFTGRSDNFGADGSGNPLDARFDPESIRVSNDGLSVFISDEYGPYVRQFDRATGALLRTYALPANLDVANVSPVGKNEEAPANTSGRVDNKGMEGLALTPDGKTLVGIMQAPLLQDKGGLLRIVTIDVATGATKEYGYKLTTGTGVSEIVAINDHQFLVDERDGKGLGDGSKAVVKSIFLIDTTNAVDISGVANGDQNTPGVVKFGTPFLDLVAALKANGFKAEDIPAKIEGLSFGQDVIVNGQVLHTLFVANDNDFLPDYAGPNTNPNQFFVFGFTDRDVASVTPEPATWGMMLAGFGLIGGAMRRRRAVAATLTPRDSGIPDGDTSRA